MYFSATFLSRSESSKEGVGRDACNTLEKISGALEMKERERGLNKVTNRDDLVRTHVRNLCLGALYLAFVNHTPLL
jgi:hypothetical protein